MARVLVLAEEDSAGVGAHVRSLLGEHHEYTVIAVAPDRHTPMLDETTTDAAQDEVDREYAATAEEEASPIGGDTSVRWGNAAIELVEAARDENADLIVVETNRPGLWGRLTQRNTVEYAISHAPCAVLFIPKGAPPH